MSGAAGRAHVVLIHGTWARNAEWTREDAPLRHRLRDALGIESNPTSISAFNWSGRNSFKARTDAATKLQALIHRLVDEDGDARIHLVGHSRGGNIALQVAADPRTAPFVSGIVCLATPVIHSTLVRAIAFATLFLALAVPPLVSLVLRLARAFGSLRTLFFGVAVVPIGSFIRMGVEPTPPGEWTVVMLPEPPADANRDEAPSAPILDAHCRVNQQPEFLAFVSEWLATRIADRGPGRPARRD